MSNADILKIEMFFFLRRIITKPNHFPFSFIFICSLYLSWDEIREIEQSKTDKNSVSHSPTIKKTK